MNLRLVFACALGLVAAISAPRSEAARGIRTDSNMVCTAPAATMGLNVELGTGNTANAGVGNLPVWVCGDTDTSTPFSDVPFDPATSALYTWTPMGDDPTGQELSGYSGSFVSPAVGIVAMVDVFNLTGKLAGDTEVDFDYNSDLSPCPASSASLTWSGKTYAISSPCNAPLMFFNSDGQEIPAPVPEPDTLMLMCAAGVPLVLLGWRRKRLSRARPG